MTYLEQDPHMTAISHHADVTIAIMAGGKSSRMGTDKSFVRLLGKPMIEHVLDRVRGLGEEIIIVTNQPESYSYLGLRLTRDHYSERGPLAGLHAALSAARYQHVLVVACDMPWLNSGLLNHMLELRHLADVVVPRWQKFPEPLHAVYHRNCLAPITENLDEEKLKLVSFYNRVTVRFINRDEIEQFDPSGRSFVNINTPEDLADIQNP